MTTTRRSVKLFLFQQTNQKPHHRSCDGNHHLLHANQTITKQVICNDGIWFDSITTISSIYTMNWSGSEWSQMMDWPRRTHYYPTSRILQTLICPIYGILAHEKIFADKYAMILLEVYNPQCHLLIYIFAHTRSWYRAHIRNCMTHYVSILWR